MYKQLEWMINRKYNQHQFRLNNSTVMLPFDCFNVSLSESFDRRSGRPTVLVPVVSSPNNN